MTEFNLPDFFERAIKDELPGKAVQFRARCSAEQYRTAYEISTKYLAQNSMVLDWGCGSGHFAYFLDYLGMSVSTYSFQETPDILCVVPRIRHTRGHDGEPIKLPYSSGTFDAVFSIGVLEHVYEVNGSEIGSMREISRILKPNGLFMCFHLPNKSGWIEPLFGGLHLLKSCHKKRFDLEGIKELSREAGFSIEEWGLYNFFPRNQLSRLPLNLANQRWFCGLYNMMDDIFAKLFPSRCQNYYFVARSQAGS